MFRQFALALVASGLFVVPASAQTSAPMSLDQCISAALAKNARHEAATQAVRVAEARRGQALSSRYPQIGTTLGATRLDEDPTFGFPASVMGVPPATVATPPMLVTLPANAFGPGFPASDVPLPVPGSTITVPGQLFPVPEQTVRLMDKTLYTGTLKAMYALYTGGLAAARIDQARAGISVANEERRQTDAELAFDVTRAYDGVILAQKLRQVASDTHERMTVTLDLTESLYKTGSGQVKKTDYLRHQAMVDTIASMVSEFTAQERSARAALEMLTAWAGPGELQVADRDFAAAPAARAVADLVGAALTGNPQLGQVRAGREAATAGIRAAQAGHRPKVGLFANVTRLGNSYSQGMVTDANKTSWSVGVGVDVPIFEGFRVTHEVNEARAADARLAALTQTLGDAVALDVRRTAIAAEKSQAQLASTGSAYKSATENRELHIRAYQDELVETKDMIEAQLVEAVLAGQYFKVQYDLAEAHARLDLLLGKAGTAR